MFTPKATEVLLKNVRLLGVAVIYLIVALAALI